MGSIVSIFASFCVWTKSLKCKDAVNRDSTIQSLQVKRNSSSLSAIQTIEPSRLDAHLFTIPSVRMTCHPVRTLDIPASSVRTPYCIEKFLCQLASVQTFLQHVRTPPSTRSVSNFFPSSKKGKINQSSGRCGIPSERASP
jgi:hypothetical protein